MLNAVAAGTAGSPCRPEGDAIRRRDFGIAVGLGTLGLAGLTGCGGGTGGGGGTAAKKTTFTLAFDQTEQHPQFKAAEAMGKKLKEPTEGRYDIKVYGNEQPGSQNEVVQNVSKGTVDMMYIGGPVMKSFNPDFIVFNLPYMFDSREAQNQVFGDQAVMGSLMKSIEGSKKITALAALHAGTRNIYNAKRAIKSPADMAGLKIRVQQSDSQVKMLQSMGGVASPMGQGEVYTALQSGVLDGAENNETVFHALKHDEVSKFYSYTRHLMIPDYLLINTDTLGKMSEADRTTFLKLVGELRTEADAGLVTYAQESKTAAEKLGAKFNDDVDMAAFKAAVKAQVDAAINNDVRKKLYEAVQAANKAFPAK
ncbi:TRAP transporter substrate-binding protein [Mariniluteicoccus flavus]